MQALIEVKSHKLQPRLVKNSAHCTTRHQNMMKLVGLAGHELPATLFELKQRAANLEVALELIADDNFDGGYRFPIASHEERAVVFISFFEELHCIVAEIWKRGDCFYSSFVWGVYGSCA